MYEKKGKSYGVIAILYYLIYFLGMWVCGIMYEENISFNSIYILSVLLFVLGVIIVLVKDRNIKNLGFVDVHKTDIVITVAIVMATFFVILIFSGLSFQNVFLQTLYYLFYIGAIEEIVFRGIIQSYLFGLKINKYLTFIIGGLLFSFMHIPFQMYVHNNVSFSYILVAIPNLIETFIFHFVCCFIAYKRKNILIPVALHYAYDILGLIM